MQPVLRLAIIGGLGALASACAILEPSVIDSDSIISNSNATIRVDVMEQLTGERYDQFRASNYGSYPICAQVVFDGTFYAGGGYSMGSTFKVPPGQTFDIGYVDYPARYEVQARLWSPRSDGACGTYSG